MIINKQIKKYREINNWSQDNLAEKMNISRQSISKWERGEALPSIENLIRLSEILEMPLDLLVNGSDSIDYPIVFGKAKSKLPFWFVTAVLLLVSIITYLNTNSIIGAILFLIVGVGFVSVITFFDYNKYYNYFIVDNYGIRVYDGTKVKILAILKAVFNIRKETLIHYSSINAVEIYFNNRGFNPESSEALNYRKRQIYIIREKFSMFVYTDDKTYDLSLDPLFYHYDSDFEVFPKIIEIFQNKDIKIIDDFNIVRAIKAEEDLINAAYESERKGNIA